jgi:hypothetical protein
MQAPQTAERDIVWEARYKLSKHDDGLALADDVMIFAYPKLKKMFKVKHRKDKNKLKKILKKAAVGAVEGYHVLLDPRESLKHKSTQCNDGPSPVKRLKVQKKLSASTSCMSSLAPPPAPSVFGRPVPRGMLGWQVNPPSPPPKPTATANLKGMLSLGKQVMSPAHRPR